MPPVHFVLAQRKHKTQLLRVMDLTTRRNIAQCLRIEMSCLALNPDVVDFLALLAQWESGVISGRTTPAPPIDPSRQTAQHPPSDL